MRKVLFIGSGLLFAGVVAFFFLPDSVTLSEQYVNDVLAKQAGKEVPFTNSALKAIFRSIALEGTKIKLGQGEADITIGVSGAIIPRGEYATSVYAKGKPVFKDCVIYLDPTKLEVVNFTILGGRQPTPQMRAIFPALAQVVVSHVLGKPLLPPKSIKGQLGLSVFERVEMQPTEIEVFYTLGRSIC